MKGSKMNRREWLKLTGLAAAGTVLAACQPQKPAAVEPASATQPPAEPQVQLNLAPTNTLEVKVPTGSTLEGFTPMMSNPSEKVKLLYWWGNNYEPAMQFTNEIIKRFSIAYPNVEVTPVGGQNCDAFVTAAAAGTPPDLFHTWDCVERMGNWASRDMIIPLDNYIAGSKFDLNDYVAGVMETCKMNGKIWGMVDSGGLFFLWSRPPAFKDMGKGPTDQPKDTDELWQWAEKLTTKGSDGNIQRLGMTVPTWNWARFAWISDFGGVLWDTNANQPTPEHPGVIEALNDMVAQVKKYGVDTLDRWTSSIGSQSGEQNPYLAGNLVFQVEGDWNGQSIFDFHPDWKVDQDYGVMAPPPPPASKLNGESAVTLWSWPWVIPAHTKNPDWSWELLRFYLSPEYQLNVHGKFKELVLRKSLNGDPRQWWPAAKKGKEVLDSGRKITAVIPMTAVASEYINLLTEAFDKILHLDEAPEDSMKRVKQETLDKMNAG